MSVKILIGDVRERLRQLPDESVHCVVTSPPYWGLRDYGVVGQLGLEPTLAEHIETMVEVLREVRRVLRKDGTLWLNYGDCYATSPNGRSAADTKAAGGDDRTFRDKPFSTIGGVLKPGDLCMIPNRLAIALQEDGWWVKSEIIWGKPNAMPDSSGSSRPSTAHEKIFLLAKSGSSEIRRARDTGEISAVPDRTEQVPMVTTGELGPRWLRMPYYYSAADVKLPQAEASVQRLSQDIDGQTGSSRANAGRKTNGNMKAVGARTDKQRGHSRRHQGFNERWDKMEREEQTANGRFLRNFEPAPVAVWEIPIQGFKDAHFATFPPDLAARAILGGCPKGGTVLDPFGGAGTTGLVADRLERNALLIELNPEYAEMARKRILGDAPMLTTVEMDAA